MKLLSFRSVLLACGLMLPDWRAFPQGSLTPPGGPLPMMKTLQQVEPRTPISSLPFIITQPGSYYVTTNIAGAVGQHGITVSADNVSIDLNGFSLIGGQGLSGIVVTGFRYNLSVRNGSVREWTGMGISAFGANDAVFEDLRLHRNRSNGLETGSNCVIRACVATENASGIVAWRGNLLNDCTARGNALYGIVANSGSSLHRCIAAQNRDTGIRIPSSGAVADCTSHANGTNGVVGTLAVISRCSITQNGGPGLDAGDFSNITGCLVQGNRADGLRANSACTIRENTFSGNGTSADHAAIHLADSGNRVEANNVMFNTLARGIRALLPDNVIVRNSAGYNNGNFDLPLNAYAGAVVTTPGAMNAATNSNANISF